MSTSVMDEIWFTGNRCMSHFGLYNFALISLVASAYAVGTSDLPSGYHSVSASLGLPVHFSVTRPLF